MKKLILTAIAMVAGATLVHAQGGLINMNNLSADIQTATNSSGAGLYGSGYPSTTGDGLTKIPTTAGAYYFAVLAATSTSASDSGNPAGGDWTVVTEDVAGNPVAVANNGGLAGGVEGPGGASGFASSLTAGITYDIMVVGWSANVGTSWAAVSGYFADDFAGWSAGGFAGYSNVGTIDPTSAPANGASVFSATGAADGQTILYALPVPEPATLALAGLGGLSMLFLRRRKS